MSKLRNSILLHLQELSFYCGKCKIFAEFTLIKLTLTYKQRHFELKRVILTNSAVVNIQNKPIPNLAWVTPVVMIIYCYHSSHFYSPSMMVVNLTVMMAYLLSPNSFSTFKDVGHYYVNAKISLFFSVKYQAWW